MDLRGERTIVIGADSVEEFGRLSSGACRAVMFLALQTDHRGVAPFSRSALATALGLSRTRVNDALKELKDKDFVAQVGMGELCVNPKKVDGTGGRMRSPGGFLIAQYERLKEGWASSHERKSAAAKASAGNRPKQVWGRNHGRKGEPHGVVEEARGRRGREGDGEAPN